jgi:hypothetical protein
MDADQLVSKVVLTIECGEPPRIDITRWVVDRGTIGAVEKVTRHSLKDAFSKAVTVDRDSEKK